MAVINAVDFEIESLKALSKKPKNLYYIGDKSLLDRRCVAIVGSRKANQYAKQSCFNLASALAKKGVAVVSGAAMGIDAMAHRGAGASNTIAVVATGLDIRYPKVNDGLIADIEKQGLVLSQFSAGTKAARWSFPLRNELVVGLADAVVVAQADRKSGSMISAKIAQKQGKKIYVLPHRLGESSGTDMLVQEGVAEVIYDIDAFCSYYGKGQSVIDDDPLLEFAKTNPSYELMQQKFGAKVFEYELEGKIAVKDAKVFIV